MTAAAEKVAPWAPWDDAEACISSLRQMLAQQTTRVEELKKVMAQAREDGARMRQMAIAARLRALGRLHPDAAAVNALADMLEREAGR